MRAHILQGNLIINTVLVDELGAGMVDADAVGGDIGDSIVGGVLVPAAPVVAVPEAVTMRQARLALLGAGKLAAVQSAINAMSEPAKTAAQITWDYSSEVQRNNGLVASLGPALGLDAASIDALFIAAAKL